MAIRYAVAQIQSERRKFKRNLEKHLQLIDMAAQRKAQFILFPELSLTGYERELAAEQAFKPKDVRLKELQQAAIRENMIIAVGGPLQLMENLYIASFIYMPGGEQLTYIKKYLHPGEELFFQSREDHDPILPLDKERIALAICFDLENDGHIQTAISNNASVYTASIFYSDKGIASGQKRLQDIATQYHIPVLMSNYCGYSWDTKAGGGSTIWSETGNVVITAKKDEECLLLAERDDSGWKGMLAEL